MAKKYKTKIYNLDAIIAVGYRINSKKATEFRIWATKILKEYMKKYYSKEEQDKYGVVGIEVRVIEDRK